MTKRRLKLCFVAFQSVQLLHDQKQSIVWQAAQGLYAAGICWLSSLVSQQQCTDTLFEVPEAQTVQLWAPKLEVTYSDVQSQVTISSVTITPEAHQSVPVIDR